MAVIQNKWIEKEKKKKAHETAPAFEKAPIDNWLPINPGKIAKRQSRASISTMARTLRGVRK